MPNGQEDVAGILRENAVKILVEKGGWVELDSLPGRVRTQSQQAELQKLEEAFTEAIAAILKDFSNHSLRLEILSGKDIQVKYFMDSNKNAVIVYLDSSGLFVKRGSHMSPSVTRIVTNDDFYSVVREFKLERADIEKAWHELDLDFVEFILKKDTENGQ